TSPNASLPNVLCFSPISGIADAYTSIMPPRRGRLREHSGGCLPGGSPPSLPEKVNYLHVTPTQNSHKIGRSGTSARRRADSYCIHIDLRREAALQLRRTALA